MHRFMLVLGYGLLTLAGLMGTPTACLGQTGGTAAPIWTTLTVEKLRYFDPAAVTLSWTNRRWQLVHHNEVLKDFAAREQEARMAMGLIRELGLNQYGTIGGPYPVMEYWLVNGQAPRAVAPTGLRVLDLEPGTLRAEQVQGQWCLCSGQRVMFSFGANPDEARQALAVVQKYGFTQVGAIGQASPSMYVFFRRPTDGEADVSAVHVGRGSSRSMTVPKFSRIGKNPDGSPHVQMPPGGSGLEGVVAPVMPPLAANGGAPPGAAVAQPTLPVRQAALWREQPRFGRPGALSEGPVAERVPFDWRQVQIRQDRGEWKLMVGGLVLANFGGNAQDARTALSALRYYRFTERMRGGDEQHPFSYYPANGQAPRGVMLGLQAESFEPEKLAVRQAADGCASTSGARVLIRLGERPEEARKLLEVIQRNKFDRLCTVGEPGKESMTFLVRSR